MKPVALHRQHLAVGAAVAALCVPPVLGATWAVREVGDLLDGSPAPLPAGAASPLPALPELEQPASATVPAPASTARIVHAATTGGIPAPALAAYQQAAAVLGDADPGCRVDWALVAAVGRVESDHGRTGGGALDAHGRARPSIIGPELDGTGAYAAVPDTDAGMLDHDTTWDRAVGPMQFIPETWRLVGVDGDGDGRREPQDVDDAALSAAVHLCSGTEDLASGPGRERALLRYNRSEEYVRLVLAVREGYLAAPAVSAVPVAVAAYRDHSPASTARARTIAASGRRDGQVGTTLPTTASTTAPAAPASPTPAPAPSGSASASPSPSPAPSSTAPSSSATPTSSTPTSSATAEPSPSSTATACPTPSAEPTADPTPTSQPSPTASATAASDPCATPGPTASSEPSPGPTPTP